MGRAILSKTVNSMSREQDVKLAYLGPSNSFRYDQNTKHTLKKHRYKEAANIRGMKQNDIYLYNITKFVIKVDMRHF